MNRTSILLIAILVLLVGVYTYVVIAGPVPRPPSFHDLERRFGPARAVDRSEVEAQGRNDCFRRPEPLLVLAPRGSCSVYVAKTWPWVRRELRLDRLDRVPMRLDPVPMRLDLVPAGDPGVPLHADSDSGEKPRVTMPIPSAGGTVSVTCLQGCSALLVETP